MYVGWAHFLGKAVCTFTYVVQDIYKVIVYFTHRRYQYSSFIQYMQYNIGNSYLNAEVMDFSINFICTGVQRLSHRLATHASVLSVFVIHVPAVPNLRLRLI
jgi:hypothetical protein